MFNPLSILRFVLRFVLRLVWGLVVAVCVLMSLGTGFLWWHSRHVYQDHLEFVAFQKYARLVSSQAGLDLVFVRRWNWPVAAELRVFSAHDRDQVNTFEFFSVGERPLAMVTGVLDVRSGRSQTYMNRELIYGPYDIIEPGNNPAMVGHCDDTVSDELLQNSNNWSVALPVVTVHAFPAWLLLSFTGFPVLIDLVLRVRRMIRRRRASPPPSPYLRLQ